MQVEVDIFSGSPNPGWQLTPQETAEFLRRFQALPADLHADFIEADLGYGGLIVTDEAAFTEIRVYREQVMAQSGQQSRLLVDRNRQLERWLWQTGAGRVEAALYRLIEQAIQWPTE